MAITFTACTTTGLQNSATIDSLEDSTAALIPDTNKVIIVKKEKGKAWEASSVIFSILKTNEVSFNSFITNNTFSFDSINTILSEVYVDIPLNGVRIIPTAGKTIYVDGLEYTVIAAISEDNNTLYEFIYNSALSLVNIQVYQNTPYIKPVSNYIEINGGVLLRVHGTAEAYNFTPANNFLYSIFNVESIIKSTNPGLVVKSLVLNNIMKYIKDNSDVYIGKTPIVIEDGKLTFIYPTMETVESYIDKDFIFQNIKPVTYLLKSGNCIYTADSDTVYCLTEEGKILWTNNIAWMAELGEITALTIDSDILIITGILGLSFMTLAGQFLCRYAYNSVTGEVGAYQNTVSVML